MEVLLEVFPAGASKLDKEGRLPLHAAAANHASLEVVNLLLEAYPYVPPVYRTSGTTKIALGNMDFNDGF